MVEDSTVSSDPNSSVRRSTDPSQNMKSSISAVLSPTQLSVTPPSNSDSAQKSLTVDKTQIIREERRKRMRSVGIHVAADDDDRTVYELPVVIKKTRSRRRVHKLKWKDGVVNPDAKSDTESTSDASYRVAVSSYVPVDTSLFTPLQMTMLTMATYFCLIISILFQSIDEKLGIGKTAEGEKKELSNREEKKRKESNITSRLPSKLVNKCEQFYSHLQCTSISEMNFIGKISMRSVIDSRMRS